MRVTEHTNILSGHLAFVPSGLRTFGPSGVHAFVSLQCVVPSMVSLHATQFLIISSTDRLGFTNSPSFDPPFALLNQQSVIKNPVVARPYSLH